MFMKSSLKLLYFSKLANIHIYLLYILYNSIQIFYFNRKKLFISLII